MGQERLTDLSILYIEKDLTNKIDIKEVIRIFAQTERKIILEWTNFKQNINSFISILNFIKINVLV